MRLLVSYHNLYNQRLMDYYRHPRCKGALENPNFTSGVYNPLCGDRVVLQGLVDQGVVTHCLFQAEGCVVSQATASMLAEYATDKTVDQIHALKKEDLLNLIQLELGPTRLRCAFISLEALQNGLNKLVV